MSNENIFVFKDCIGDLLITGDVIAMRKIRQHYNINCLEHSLFVSYISYRVCRFLGWDFKAAARGGLLHDIFLYDRHNKDSYSSPHLSGHPKAAFANASRICELSDREKDIILKHMWPLTFRFPKYKESYVVNITDTVCAFIEMMSFFRRRSSEADENRLYSRLINT